MQDRVAIVGAGPAGLTLGRDLAALGVPFTIFERNADVGGLWNDADPASPVYDAAHLISSRTMTGFADYPMPEDWADYPSRAHVLNYIRAFARDHDLLPNVRLGEGVEAATPLAGGGWKVTTTKGGSEDFRWLVAANGSNWAPVLPDWPGAFTGTLRHAATYRNGEEVRGQRVLVVGLGNSGADIACDASRTASRVAVSIRRGYHMIPKHILGKPADVFNDTAPPLPFRARQMIFGTLLRIIIGDLTRFGMPKPDHRIMETHPLLNDQLIHHLRHGDVSLLGDIERFDGENVVFRDGSREAFDQVICATGYDWETPYLPDDALPWDRGRLTLPLCIFTGRDDLFTLSFVESNGSSFSLFNEMSQIIAHAIDDQRQNRADAVARLRGLIERDDYDLTGSLHMQGTDRHVGYVDNKTYRKALKKLARQMGWAPVPHGA